MKLINPIETHLKPVCGLGWALRVRICVNEPNQPNLLDKIGPKMVVVLSIDKSFSADFILVCILV